MSEAMALSEIQYTDPAVMIVEHLAAAMLPAAERTGNPDRDAIRILNRAYVNIDPAKTKQRMANFHGIVLTQGQRPIVMAPVMLPPGQEIDRRPASNTSLVETIHEVASQPARATMLVFLTQQRGAALADLRTSYPNDVIWICRSGQTPAALSRRGYQQILTWNETGLLDTVRPIVRLLASRDGDDRLVKSVDTKIDKLVAKIDQPYDALYRCLAAINDETWSWANRKLALMRNSKSDASGDTELEPTSEVVDA